MKKIAYAAFASVAALALAACGSSDKTSEEAQAENVEMPAEEAMNTADAMATPAADASVDASAAASASASGAAEAATTDAETKM
jgi:predicted component of type VI protein secretion system